MNFVEPIRDRKKIAQIKNLLRGQSRYRDLLLFTVGINSALRISDLLSLRIGDFVDEQKRTRSRFWIKEKKRGKRQEIVINDSIRAALDEYVLVYPKAIESPQHFTFFSTTNSLARYTKALRRNRAWEIINGVCRDVGLHGNYGTHSLRKTWGYHARMSGVDIELIMEKLNHNSLAYTKRYLGITSAELAAVARRLNL